MLISKLQKAANFEAYDVQATHKEARDKMRKEAIAHAIKMMKEASVSREVTKQQLIKQFELSPETAEENLRLHW